MGHGRLEQPGSVEPVAEPGSEPLRTRPHTGRPTARAAGLPAPRPLPAGGSLAASAPPLLARGDAAAAVPLPAAFPELGGPAARAHAAAGGAGCARSRHGPRPVSGRRPALRRAARVAFYAFLVLVAVLLVR